jgi:hypothetical protein
MASLQNLQNKEVICKIFQAKELCVILAPNDSFRLEGGSKTPGIIVRRSTEIICSHLRWGSRSLFARMDIRGLPPFAKYAKDGAPGGIFGKLTEDIPQGLKPVVFYQPLTARLKSCPDAMRPLETLSTSFSAACEAVPFQNSTSDKSC